MGKLYNLARMTTATTGTGTVTLSSAVAPFLTFVQAGISNGDVVSYSIIDGTSNSEIGTGTYTGSTLTRTVTKSTNSNAAISLSGSAQVFVTPRAEDFLLGTTTNDSAAAGYIGESIDSVVANGSAVTLTNGTGTNVTSISLTAGDWDVMGEVQFKGTTELVAYLIGSISTTSATLDASKGQRCDLFYSATNSVNAVGNGLLPTAVLSANRFSLSGTTTVYLVALDSANANTVGAFGFIHARRVR